MTKRVFLIHGWNGYTEEGWQPWLRNELENRGFKVFMPSMPDTKYPKADVWVKHLAEIIGTPDKDCYFVGHSLGCITILRYLETLKENQEVGGVILVAGFTSNLGYEELNSFFLKQINWQKIKPNCRKFVAVHSDNDPYVSLHYGDFFKEKLNAKIIVKHNMKHFSGDDGVMELPVVLDNLLMISSSIKKLKNV